MKALTHTRTIIGVFLATVLLVAAQAVSAEETTIQSILFGDTGLVYTEPETVYQPSIEEGTSSWFGSSFYDFFSSLFLPQTTDTQTYTSTEADTVTTTESLTPPTVACIPNVLEEGEPFLLAWQCNDDSEMATIVQGDVAHPFDPAGILQLNGYDQEVWVICSSGAKNSCQLNLTYPFILFFNASAATVPMWETVSLEWETQDMQDCVLTSDDDNSKYADWQRRGIRGTNVISHPITKDTTFTLTCTTKTGLTKKADVFVSVLTE